MIRTWQDFDENCRACWGLWFGTFSIGGHIVRNTGPHQTEAECREALQ